MKSAYIIGNWKANKTVQEAGDWFEEIQAQPFDKTELPEIIICVSFIHLPILKEKLLTPKPGAPVIKIGAQDISRFEEGPYTGEIAGNILKDLAEYVIIGHSERRKYFWETEETLKAKVKNALKFGLKPIYCISEKEMIIPEGVEIVAYEPLFAIGTGSPDTPDNANETIAEIKKRGQIKVLYGGSVKPDNAHIFTSQPAIDGLLIGGASLSASEFSAIIKNAA